MQEIFQFHHVPEEKKQKSFACLIERFLKIVPAPTQNEQTDQRTANTPEFVKPLGFVREYPLFEDCQRRNILYDVGEIMTRNIINEVPDDVKYEMLVETNYLPKDFEFP